MNRKGRSILWPCRIKEPEHQIAAVLLTGLRQYPGSKVLQRMVRPSQNPPHSKHKLRTETVSRRRRTPTTIAARPMQKSFVRPMRNPLFSPSFQNRERVRRSGYEHRDETITDLWRRLVQGSLPRGPRLDQGNIWLTERVHPDTRVAVSGELLREHVPVRTVATVR